MAKKQRGIRVIQVEATEYGVFAEGGIVVCGHDRSGREVRIEIHAFGKKLDELVEEMDREMSGDGEIPDPPAATLKELLGADAVVHITIESRQQAASASSEGSVQTEPVCTGCNDSTCHIHGGEAG